MTFNGFTEQGTIYWNGTEDDVVKHGSSSGHWTLQRDGEVVIDAQKTSAFTRTLELVTDGGPVTLQAQSVFTRGFDLLQSGTPVGTILPMHMFTRRATIDCGAEVEELTQLFAFWLVVIYVESRQKRTIIIDCAAAQRGTLAEGEST